MKKILLIFIFAFLISRSAFPQAGEWVWLKGDISYGQPGNYGVQGVAAVTNNPPGIYEPCEWKDLNGNFWLFGGSGLQGRYGDLWKYDPAANMWIWMKGNGIANDPGSFGVQGVSSPLNNPPARSHGMTSWVDSSGNFWMFGGLQNGLFSDLWKYDPATNEWTWMKGPQVTGNTGVYGTLGVPDTANCPSGRRETAAGWADDQGNIWLFGGYSTNGIMNDLWRYNIATNTWTWMKGSQTSGQAGVYGTLGVEAATNTPGSRMPYSHWKDNNGNFWLFGGGDYFSNVFYNDLWRFNPLTNNWTWMKGSNVANNTGNYGIKCDSAMSNLPVSRFENRVSVTDQFGNFWMYGGSQDGSISTNRNDLWVYCPSLNQWMWTSGDATLNPLGNWGTQGVSSPSNNPSGRGGAVGWNDDNGHIYFFGGAETSVSSQHDDLWKYTIDTACNLCETFTNINEYNGITGLSASPNPAHAAFTLLFPSSFRQPIEIVIYNSIGKRIYSLQEQIEKGKFEKEINVEQWSEGIYFLQVKTKEGIVSKKVMVQN